MNFRKIITLLPGLILLLSIALFSEYMANFLPKYIGSVFIAISLGILINNLFALNKKVFSAGISFGSRQILKLAIVLLGAGISLNNIVENAKNAIFLIFIMICFCTIITFMLGKALNISIRQRLLISTGICICGNTAIATIAPILKAEDAEVTVGVSIITLFGILGVLIFPLIGQSIALSDKFFGYWAGTAINDTSQVVAAGFIYSDIAGEIATTIKLIRNLFMLPVIFITSVFFWNKQTDDNIQRIAYHKMFPMFIIGFLLVAFMNSIGLFSFTINSFIFTGSFSFLLTKMSKFLILIALSGIGLGVNLKDLRLIGVKPFILGFVVEVLMAFTSFTLISLFWIQ